MRFVWRYNKQYTYTWHYDAFYVTENVFSLFSILWCSFRDKSVQVSWGNIWENSSLSYIL